MLRLFVIAFTSFLLWTLVGIATSSAGDVCASPERATTSRAMLDIFQYHGDAIVEMGKRRGGVPLPMFDPNDFTPVTGYIRRYTRGRKDSGFMIFAADKKHICSYLFLRGSLTPLYHRQAITAAEIQRSNGDLRRAILCGHLGKARAPRLKRDGSIIPWFVEASDPNIKCDHDSKAVDSIELLSKVFFPLNFRVALSFIRHLSILPIRGLSAVPVAILEPYGNGKQAVETFSINFVAFFPDIRSGPSATNKAFITPLIVGDPEATSDPEYDFESLPGALQEALEVHKALGGRLLKQADAKVKPFIASAQNADLIYIAAHGLSEFQNSLDNSFIAMSDGRLTARRVQKLKLKRSPVVVLSACQTGLGTIVEAGIIGIGRAFQKAGASNTVMSLWSVFDEPTLYMMREFRRHLPQSHPAEALRRAMLAGKKRYNDPVNWSGFVVLGN